jgi:hypothetical protein
VHDPFPLPCQRKNANHQDLSFQTFKKVFPSLAKAYPYYYWHQDEIIDIEDNEKLDISHLRNIHIKVHITPHKLDVFPETFNFWLHAFRGCFKVYKDFWSLHIRCVATLALGSQPRQGIARLQAKRKTQESYHMLSGVQRVWGNEPSHSQVNSNVGSWSPKWTPESSERNCKGQNSFPCRVLYIIRNILKHTCLKWACIAHLDIWNTSYGQKKGWESNWQFDSWPLKVGNRPDFLACRQRATYRWKALKKG